MTTFPNGLPAYYDAREINSEPVTNNLNMGQIKIMHDTLNKTFRSNKTKTLRYRRQQLLNLKKGLIDLHQDLCDHVCKDFKVPEDFFFDFYPCLKELTCALENLDSWVSCEHVSKPWAYLLDNVYTKNEPFGIALIISTWNFPIQLSIVPLIGAISAGNCAVVKVSEKVPYTNMIMRRLFAYLDSDSYQMLECEVNMNDEILELNWDFIFYTGSGNIAKKILKRAASNLTPTCLELGGKNPVVFEKSANFKVSAKRILWGKMLNSGQICISPDYIICEESIKGEVLKALVDEARKTYSKTKIKSQSKMITKEHTIRLANMLKTKEDKIVYGGDYDIDSRYISPTIVSIKDPQTSVYMKDELFGPILLVVGMDNNEIAEFIKNRAKPLAFYIFSSDRNSIEYYLDSVSSGTVAINDTILQHQVNTMPFGGVGGSGFGGYMGKYTFDLFSHKKSILQKNFFDLTNYARYKPTNNEIIYPLFFPDMFKPFEGSGKTSRFLNKVFVNIRWIWLFITYMIKCAKGEFSEKIQ